MVYIVKRQQIIGKSNPAYKHGESSRINGQSKEYRAWAGIKTRCNNPNRDNSKYYNNLEVCERWSNSFEAFFEDMGRAPTIKHSIERIDNKKGYSAENCRWATQIEQANNKTSNRMIRFNNQTHTIAEWGRITGLGGSTISKRLNRGWSIEQTLGTEKKKNQWF